MTEFEPFNAVISPRGKTAVCIQEGASAAVRCDPSTRGARFEVGSLTKTFTATLLAHLAVEQTVSLDTTASDLLSVGGELGSVTLAELATHTSGLPRLAPNAMTLPFWPRDPYRFFRGPQLRTAMTKVELTKRGEFQYSNLGYMILGACLEAATDTTLASALDAVIFEPLDMEGARCQPCRRGGLAKSVGGSWLTGGRRWREPLPGASGVDATIDDLRKWLCANVEPPSYLDEAMTLAHAPRVESKSFDVALGWFRDKNGTLWHDGATGSFQSFIAVSPRVGGFGVLASQGISPHYSLSAIARPLAEAQFG